ncbi:PEP-CTERM sorting domain-containing protein [Planctomycetota bacterium]|nr:PEP-CTERM sorting domain-containing protein [Planctomycetota bacterium]
MRELIAKCCAVAVLCSLGMAQVDAGMLWVSDGNGKLATIDTQTWQVDVKGTMPKVMTDIAMDDDGKLWGTDRENMYRIWQNTAKITDITSGTKDFGNALGVVDGEMISLRPDYMMGINTSTGNISRTLRTDRLTSGDLEQFNGKTYMVSYYTKNNDYTNVLAELDVNTGRVTDIGSFGRKNVYGLAEADGKLYAASENVIYEVNTNNGHLTKLRKISQMEQIWGMTSVPETPVIPEPASAALIGLGIVALLGRRRG